MPAFHALVIGLPHDPLTQQACQSLQARAQVSIYPSVASLLASEIAFPAATLDLIVVVVERGGTFTDGDVAALKALAPLSPIWRLLGNWCEGEQRTGQPPAGCVNVYASHWQARIGRELAAGASQGLLLASASLPVSMAIEERILWEDTQPLARGEGLIGIIADTNDAAQSLAELCTHAGYSTIRLYWNCSSNPAQQFAAVLWDCDPRDLNDQERLKPLLDFVGNTPVIALLGFPRPEDIELAFDSGIAAVIAKPYAVRDLLWQLKRLIGERNGVAEA